MSNNIMFFFEEKVESKDNDNSDEIEKLLYELEHIEEEGEKKVEEKLEIDSDNFLFDIYTVKQLLRICNYYDIEKTVKMAKYKKQDIIDSILYFESLPENAAIVNERRKMWYYIRQLTNNQKMKKYVIW